MTLKCYATINNKVDSMRYHIYTDDNVVSASAREWNIKKMLSAADSYDVCQDERCLLCWSYNLSKMPFIQPGELLVFTQEKEIEDIVLVTQEFDPYDDDINTVDDLIALGYAEKVNYLEILDE